MKKDHHHQRGSHSKEEEDPQEEDHQTLMEVDWEDHREDNREDHQEGQTQEIKTSLLTCDLFPKPMMQRQWENFPMSSTETEPRLSHLSTS